MNIVETSIKLKDGTVQFQTRTPGFGKGDIIACFDVFNYYSLSSSSTTTTTTTITNDQSSHRAEKMSVAALTYHH